MAETRRLSTSQRNIFLSQERHSRKSINTLHIVLSFLEEVQNETICAAVDAVTGSIDLFSSPLVLRDGFRVFAEKGGSPKPCRLIRCSSSELPRRLDERKYDYLPLDGLPYDFCLFAADDGQAALSLQIHHILIDGFSTGLLCNEILKAYEALSQDRHYQYLLPQFFGLERQDPPDESSFWKEYLRDIQPYTASFPTGEECAKALEYKGSLSGELSQAIDRYCADNSLRPYTVFMAALAIYQMYIRDAEESYIVLPRLNRDTADERKAIGCFVLPVPLRIRRNDSFMELCRSIEAEGKLASAHKKCGLSEILEVLMESGGDDTLLQYTLNFQKSNIDSKSRTKLSFSACGAMSNLATLNISDWNSDGTYEITYDYRGDVLSEAYMTYFHGSLIRILRQVLDGMDAVGELAILTEEEESFLKTGMRGRSVALNSGEMIISLFEKAAVAAGGGPAVIAEDQTLSFARLDELSNAVANKLRTQGVIKGSLAAFRLKRDSNLVPVILGILKAGCAFLPIDLKYPAGRTEYILENSRAGILIDETNVRDYTGYEDTRKPDVRLDPEDLAYCIYTSGTTGKPKGVLLKHRGIVNIANPGNNPFNQAITAAGKGILAIGSIAFDISLFELFVMLLNGKYVVLAPDDAMADALKIADLIMANDVNILHCTPSRLNEYMTIPAFEKALRNLDYLLSAGEVLPKSLIGRLSRDYEIQVFNGYGPTECTIGATITEAGDNETIGRPIANTGIHILNKAGKRLPFGTVGEIAISGAGVGREYLGLPELTQEKFILLDGERAYRTGDFGFFAMDGRVRYIGRNDNQVKLRGLRIELSEIENCLLSSKGIDGCAVLVLDIGGRQHLTGFYTGPEAEGGDEIKAYLRRHLTYYMVPDILIKLERMPLTVNGKIDKEALAKIDIEIRTDYVAPATREEQILCEAFEYALEKEKVGVNDNFFESGGTSLLAAKVMVHVKKNHLALDYADIFENPTPSLLAKNLQNRRRKDFDAEMGNRDYTRIDALLTKNIRTGKPPERLGEVLLTGATGYLGCHVLDELMQDPTVGTIYCLVRSGKKISAERRLKAKLFYYFDGKHTDSFSGKIRIIEGDITDRNCLEAIGVPIDTVINSAANVAHFVYGDSLREVNVDGVANLVSFCRKKNSRLIQISTISIGGFSAEEGKVLAEQSLYLGQTIHNQYVYSKYEAECLVLEAAAGGLPARILRVGNLQGRLSDGEFQMNLKENAFASHLKCYYHLGFAPTALKEATVNLSPVDETAKAIVLLSKMPSENTVFHVVSSDEVHYKELFQQMEKVLGITFGYLEESEFEALLDEYAKDGRKYKQVESILIEKNGMRMKEVAIDSAFTVEMLKESGFEYHKIKDSYLEQYFKALDGLGFFEEEGMI